MARKVTIFTGQWADLPFDVACQKIHSFGYDGVEIACWGGHLDIEKAAKDPHYVEERKAILKKNQLGTWCIGAHLVGQCVCDPDHYDKRLDGFAPADCAGDPEKIRKWGIETMKLAPLAAKNMGVKVVSGFMGSPIWHQWYSFPQTDDSVVDAGFKRVVDLWTPILDEFDKYGIKFALEVHPTEIAFDYYTTQRLLEEFKHRPTLGINFDPSHLIWQGVQPHLFLHDFADRIYHVHMKDARVKLDGRASILGSHITFGDMRRGWNFVSLGHGSVDFDLIIRELNAMNYQGPLSVEWEDSGMDREFGAKEALEFVHKVDYPDSNVAFDAAMKTS
jgi:sugar phosphate isomerase/epimerase